jgi:plasmid stabilization system protein ParE
MGRRIVYSPDSRRDYEEIYLYIAVDNPAVAEKLLHTFDEKLQLALSAPGMGEPHPELGEGIRTLKVGKPGYIRIWRTHKPHTTYISLPPLRGKVRMGVEVGVKLLALWPPPVSTPTLILPLLGGGNRGYNSLGIYTPKGFQYDQQNPLQTVKIQFR